MPTKLFMKSFLYTFAIKKLLLYQYSYSVSISNCSGKLVILSLMNSALFCLLFEAVWTIMGQNHEK